MTNYGKMAKDAADRRGELEGELRAAKKTVASCEAEIAVLDQILAALKGAAPAGAAKRGRPKGSGRRAKSGRAAAKKPGKWRPGRPGRPPKWYVEQQKGKATGTKAASSRRVATRKKSASPKMLAALAKAREVLAAKRAAAARTPASSS